MTEQASTSVRERLESEMKSLGERQLNTLANLLERVARHQRVNTNTNVRSSTKEDTMEPKRT